ncbi:MAG: hypothetical protein QM530_08635 [Phycisphaerales bacterium]|nr:hypothetical protein [Phycisphaerales bacterium]
MKNFILPLMLLGLCSKVNAQNKSIIVLGRSPKQESKKSKYKESSMAIKFGALNFISGNIPICFEKEYKNFALLVGVGPTFRRFLDNSFWSTLTEEEDIIYSWGETKMSTINNPFDFDTRPKFTYSPSYYLVVNPKYYYNEEGMDGGYFGIQCVMSQYSYKNQGYNSTSFSKSGRDRYTDISVQWGAQYGDNKFVFEWFTGLGIRFKDELRYAYATDDNSNIIEGTAQIKKSSLHFDLGMRVGFKF